MINVSGSDRTKRRFRLQLTVPKGRSNVSTLKRSDSGTLAFSPGSRSDTSDEIASEAESTAF